jgi:hypothetical protein
MSSTIGPVKAALVALFSASLSGVQVIYGPIQTKTVTAGSVLTVGDVSGSAELDSLATGTAVERYTVACSISCGIHGPDAQQAATEAAMAFYVGAELAVREHPTGDLGVSGVLQALPTGEFELTETAEPSGRYALIQFSVYVQAQRT